MSQCRNGLWSPFGIETLHVQANRREEYVVGMACGARLGLKRYKALHHTKCKAKVGMACGARLGLKPYHESQLG